MNSPITFSTRPFTFGELELSFKMATHSDISAVIDLIVARSEPHVTREEVCALTESEALVVITELGKSFGTAAFLRKLLESTTESEAE